MAEYQLKEIEMRFAEMILSDESFSSRELINLAEKEIEWKKSTTYTILW